MRTSRIFPFFLFFLPLSLFPFFPFVFPFPFLFPLGDTRTAVVFFFHSIGHEKRVVSLVSSAPGSHLLFFTLDASFAFFFEQCLVYMKQATQ